MKTIQYFSIAILATFLFNSCQGDSNKIKVLEGKVKRETISIAPKVPGRIIEIRVNEGDNVKQGDTLAVIDIPEVEAKMQQAEGAVLSAKSQYEMAIAGARKEQIQQVKAMFDAAKEQYDFADKSLKRIRSMFQDSLIAPQKYDEALAKHNAARAQLNAATAKKNEVLGGVRGEKIKMAEGQMKRAQGALLEAQIAHNERFIIAPINMSVETIALHKGELSLPGYNVFIGYAPKTTYFRFTVRESLLNKFEKGKTYNIKLPFDKEKMIKSKLVAVKQLASYATKTSAYPNYELGESVYELKFVPLNKKETEKLFNNYTAIISL